MSKTFSTKSNAARAAAAVGLTRESCIQAADGRWTFCARALVLQADGYNQHTLDYLLEVEVAKREAEAAAKPAPAAPVAPEQANTTTGTPAYKDFQLYGRSVALGPVALVHKFLNEQGDKLSRKEALFELSKLGVNYATARTQYQRWFSGRAK